MSELDRARDDETPPDPPSEAGRTNRKGFLRRSALLGGVAAGSAFLGACGSSGDSGSASAAGSSFPGDDKWARTVKKLVDGRTITIGFTPPALSEFYDEIEHGAYAQMRELQSRFGVKWKWTRAAPAEHEAVETQVNTIEDWSTKKFDVILVCTAGDFASMQRVYESAEQKGSAVFQFNMPAELWPTDAIKARSTIGYDNAAQAGFLAGNYIAQQLNGKGKILQIWGLPGHWSTSRENGLKAAIKQYPGLQIVGKQRGDYVRDKGLNAAQNLLERDKDVQAIYGENEEMALGASQAIDALGLDHWDGKKGIITIGADGLKSGYESIEAGRLTATVNVNPVEQGRQSIQTIFDSLVLGYTVDRVINVPTIVVHKDNVDESKTYVEWALDQPKI
jgi:ABC-type sugar transport system substrate-binding protein